MAACAGLRRNARTMGIAAICALLAVDAAAVGRRGQNLPEKGTNMTKRAEGTFDVKVTPATVADLAQAAGVGAMSIEKQYRGDLEATGQGEMLHAATEVKGSGVYVAIEKVSGTLASRRGTFLLQHSGTMRRGEPQLTVTVVPDSGTGELAGLTGRMNIIIADGKHSYELEYDFEDAH